MGKKIKKKEKVGEGKKSKPGLMDWEQIVKKSKGGGRERRNEQEGRKGEGEEGGQVLGRTFWQSEHLVCLKRRQMEMTREKSP